MADKKYEQSAAAAAAPAPGEAPFARRITDTSSDNREGLSAEQVRFIRRTELEVWRRGSAAALQGRNLLTGLAIGAAVAAIYGYTFHSVSQERVMDEMDKEAKRARRMSAPKTGAN